MDKISPTQFLKHVLDDVTNGDFPTVFIGWCSFESCTPSKVQISRHGDWPWKNLTMESFRGCQFEFPWIFYKLPVIHRVVFWKKTFAHLFSIHKKWTWTCIAYRKSRYCEEGFFSQASFCLYTISIGACQNPVTVGHFFFSMKGTLLLTLIANCYGVWAVSTIYTCWRTILSLGMVKLAWSKP